MTLSTFNHPLTWALGFLLAANVVASILPTWRVQHASVADANLRGRRAYPEYVAAIPDDATRNLMVLISNSQAAYDGRDAEALYPALLRKHFAATGVPYHLENWSADGIRIVEAELLTRQALTRHAAVIVVVIGVANIDTGRQATLDFGNSDIDLLAGDPTLWPSLRDSVTTKNLESDTLASRIYAFNLPLVRARLAGQDWASEHVPVSIQAPLFGRALQHPTRIVKADAANGSGISRPRRPADPVIGDEELAPRLEVLELFAQSLHREAAARGTKVVWCWAPVAVDRLHPRLRAEGLAFYVKATPLLQAKGFAVHDLTAAIPDEQFFDGTHLRPEGHERMSELMFGTLGDALQ